MEQCKAQLDSLEYDLTKTTPCANMCGMCPSCVFAKTPLASSTEHLWTVGDSFYRKFLMDLLSRCRSIGVLEDIRRVLDVTSWTMFTYSRSERLVSPVVRTRLQEKEKPLEFNGHETREWFDSSPDWIKSHYVCRLLLRCDTGLQRALANLTEVLIIRQKHGLLNFDGCKNNNESDEPALMVIPGSSKSYSGISRYKDFISGLPVNLTKRIFGLLDESSLRICEKVCQVWQSLAKETLHDFELKRSLDEEIAEIVKESKDLVQLWPYYANHVKVRVPVISGKEDHVSMKTVEMEERNVYCGGYCTSDVMNKHDPHRVLDYGGKTLMAVGSKDGAVHLLRIGAEAKVISVLKGHMVQVRAVMLCENKNMVIIGNIDAIIRCWDLKTETCVMTLSGHTGPVNCLDISGDRLASGAKDCRVKIWSLEKGNQFEEYKFKHPGAVKCVKINQTRVYSSCDKGVVKIWDLETAAVLRVIGAHSSSVKCIFFDEWYLLTGDVKGLVMAWSTNCDSKDCLKKFNNPKEVKSLTMSYLRVVTGCADGKIRIFNFLSGNCIREIVAGDPSNHILSVHFYESSIVVNGIASVKCYHFEEVTWDYVDSSKDPKHVQTEVDMISNQSKRRSVNQVASPSGKIHNRGKSLLCLTSSTTRHSTQVGEQCDKVALSEKKTSERIKKRGPHHPSTQDFIRLKVNAVQKAQCMDEVGVNMERNAKIRDDWGPSDDLEIVRPKVMSTQKQSSPKSALKREVWTAPGRIMRPHPPAVDKTPSQSAKTRRLVQKRTMDVTKEPESLSAKAIADLESFMKSLKTGSRADITKDQTEFRLDTNS